MGLEGMTSAIMTGVMWLGGIVALFFLAIAVWVVMRRRYRMQGE